MSDNVNWHEDGEALVLRYLQDPRSDLKDMIMVHYAGLVERTARKFSGMEAIEDLLQVGFIGLLNALTKYDAEAGVRFNTYATYLVSGEIKHYLRDRSLTIRHPAWLQELRHKVNRTAGLLQQTLGRTASAREIADKLGVSEASVNEVYQTQDMLKLASLDQGLSPDEDGDEHDKLDASTMCAEQLSVEDRLLLEHAMAQLRSLEREVLTLFHFRAMNQTEIANELGLSCNYVSHILRQSLAKLRKILTSEEENDRKLRAVETNYDLIDPLTGAYTEQYFHARLTEELHRAMSGQGAVSVVMVHFSGLEHLQRFYGEASVRDFLSDAADFLKSNVRRLDILARCGDSSFGVLLPGASVSAQNAHKRLMGRIEEWMNDRVQASGCIEMSVQQATAPKDGKTVNELMAVLNPPVDGEAPQRRAA
ncbi:MAG: sigma-70 family RNA polymerase sigma factor [Armatimonadetes bacterium]|nr:sigma-70 family RNA polymerase sigma factor [Armatimonadota bacterium]